MTSRPTRRQATLFLRGRFPIDDIRARFNPEQSRLIAGHVTLCREDEVHDWDSLAAKLRSTPPDPVTLGFGSPVREGNMLFLPSSGSVAEFDDLRAYLLDPPVRKHEPHITLIHPRNGKCTDEVLELATSLVKPFSHTFGEISFIEQAEGKVWKIIESFALGNADVDRDGTSH